MKKKCTKEITSVPPLPRLACRLKKQLNLLLMLDKSLLLVGYKKHSTAETSRVLPTVAAGGNSKMHIADGDMHLHLRFKSKQGFALLARSKACDRLQAVQEGATAPVGIASGNSEIHIADGNMYLHLRL